MTRAVSGARWLAALAASALIGRGLLLPPDDPLHAILWPLPLVVVALLEIGEWAGRRGSKSGSSTGSIAEFSVLATLVIAAIGREHLGIRYSEAVVDPLLVAGFLLLLANRTARLVLALRSALGQRLEPRPPLPFFFLPLVVYLAVLPWSTEQRPPNGDEPYYLLLTHSLADDIDVDLTDEYAEGVSIGLVGRRLGPQTGDPVGPGGELYSRHSSFLPLLLVPAYAVAGKLGALVAMACLAAALAWLFLRLAERYDPTQPDAALGAYSIFAFSAPLFLYSYQVWTEVPAAVLTVLAVDQILRLEEDATPRWRRWLLIGTAITLLPILKLRYALIAGPILAFAWWRAPSFRRWFLAVGAVLGAGGAAVLAYQQLMFGNALRIYEWSTIGWLASRPPGVYLETYSGLMFDCAFGLASAGPIWLLVLPAVLLVLRRSPGRLVEFLVLLGPYFFLLGGRGEWWGAWSPPFRYGLIALPFLALLLVPLFADRRRSGAQALLVGLGLLTLLLTVCWVVFPNWTYNFSDGRSHLLDHLSLRFELDWARLFPSFARPRAATLVWPVVAVALVCGLWWIPRRGNRVRAGLAGGSALLLAAAFMLTLAARLPTRIIDLEDPQVVKRGGRVYPEQWTQGRYRYRGSWRLEGGDEVILPIRPGNERFDLELHYRAEGEPLLEVTGGNRVLEQRRLVGGERWEVARFEDLDWPGGENRLKIRARAVDTPSGASVLLDRAHLSWHGSQR